MKRTCRIGRLGPLADVTFTGRPVQKRDLCRDDCDKDPNGCEEHQHHRAVVASYAAVTTINKETFSPVIFDICCGPERKACDPEPRSETNFPRQPNAKQTDHGKWQHRPRTCWNEAEMRNLKSLMPVAVGATLYSISYFVLWNGYTTVLPHSESGPGRMDLPRPLSQFAEPSSKDTTVATPFAGMNRIALAPTLSMPRSG